METPLNFRWWAHPVLARIATTMKVAALALRGCGRGLSQAFAVVSRHLRGRHWNAWSQPRRLSISSGSSSAIRGADERGFSTRTWLTIDPGATEEAHMAVTTIAIGTQVLAQEGVVLGDTSGFVVNRRSLQFNAIAFDRGPLSAARLANARMVDRWSAAGIVLSIGVEDARRLPMLFRRDVVPEQGDSVDMDGPAFKPPVRANDGLKLHIDALFAMPAAEKTTVDTCQGVPDGDVIWSPHTQIITADGFTVGQVHGLVLGANRHIDAIDMTVGRLIKHCVRMPSSVIAEFTDDRVTLTMGLEEATESLDEESVRAE